MKTKRKGGLRVLHFRKNDPVHNVHAAISQWVRANEGALLVTGPIQIMRWPGDAPYRFDVVLKCLGTPPVKKDKQ